MKKYLIPLLTVFLLHFSINPLFAEKPSSNEYNFSLGMHDWIGAFSDYPPNEESFYELSWGWENLPAQIEDFTKGAYLSGNNHSDDLFMYIKHPIEGLEPNTSYSISVSATIDANIPPGIIGIGGSPGESVYVKIGASTEEPINININGQYALNVDKGNQSTGSENAVVVGDLANQAVDPKNPQYTLKYFDNAHSPLIVKSDDHGRVWVFFGTDSGFEATTKYYIVQIKINLETVTEMKDTNSTQL